jgi:hypothetical protein
MNYSPSSKPLCVKNKSLCLKSPNHVSKENVSKTTSSRTHKGQSIRVSFQIFIFIFKELK